MDAFALADDKGVTANTAQPCLVIVVGNDFGPLPSGSMPSLFPESSLSSATSPINEATGLRGPALFYLEALIKFNGTEGSTTSSAFTFEPQYFYYPKFIGQGGWRFESRRDILIRAELSEPGKNPFGAIEFKWENVEQGSITSDAVRKMILPWSPLPDGLADAIKMAKSNDLSPVLPVNVKAMFMETAHPKVLSKYVSESLKSQKDNITSNIQETVTQSLSQQARITARQASLADIEKKYSDYTTAYDVAMSAHEKYAAATSQQEKARLLVAAKLAYAKVDTTKTLAKSIYGGAGLGTFQELPELPPLQ
jgi:hypothetical protein